MDKQQLEKDVELLKKKKMRLSSEICRLRKLLGYQEKIAEVEKSLDAIRTHIDDLIECPEDASELSALSCAFGNLLEYRKFLEEVK